jgi:hypothetical protein
LFAVKSIALKSIKEVNEGSSISICFERSGKVAVSKEKVLIFLTFKILKFIIKKK